MPKAAPTCVAPKTVGFLDCQVSLLVLRQDRLELCSAELDLIEV